MPDPFLPQLPASSAVDLALQVVGRYASPALRNHSVRSYLLAALHADRTQLRFDPELLAVAALLHDLGLVPSFDSHRLPFEEAGGDVGWVFAAGAGWSAARRYRVREVVVRHMREPVTPEQDPESYLLQFSTSLDISARRLDELPATEVRAILAGYPRLDLAGRFTACFRDQAERKPGGAAARAVAGGVADRLAGHPLDRL